MLQLPNPVRDFEVDLLEYCARWLRGFALLRRHQNSFSADPGSGTILAKYQLDRKSTLRSPGLQLTSSSCLTRENLSRICCPFVGNEFDRDVQSSTTKIVRRADNYAGKLPASFEKGDEQSDAQLRGLGRES